MKHISRQNILTLCLLAILAIPYTAQAGVNPKKIEKLIAPSFDQFAPTGLAVAVVKDGDIIYSGAFGYKDASEKAPLNTQSLFSIASCSKAFTAAAIGLLVQEGKIRWDDKVIDYIPGFQLEDACITASLTIEDLLCHRSGLGTFYGDLLWYGTEYTNAEIIQRMRYLPIKQGFRTQFGYQNNMYMVAGEVIRKVTGKTWSEFVAQRFFKPLGMAESRPSNDELSPGQNIAWGHIKGEKIPMYDFNATKPAASIYSSVEELSNWTRMLMAGGKWNGVEILTPRTIRTLFSPKTVLGTSPVWESWGVHFRSYGLGWSMFDYAGKKVVEHNGGMPGYISKVCLVPEENISVVVLNNGMDGLINDVVRFKVLDLILDHKGEDWDKVYGKFKEMGEGYQEKALKERAASRQTGQKMSFDLKTYVGSYVDKMYGEAKVEMRGSDLLLTLLPTKDIFNGKMEHWHYDTFKVVFNDPFLTYALVTFEVDSAGKISGFKIDLPSDDFHFYNLDFRRK